MFVSHLTYGTHILMNTICQDMLVIQFTINYTVANCSKQHAKHTSMTMQLYLTKMLNISCTFIISHEQL